ncbi:MAG: hypothetical protein O3B74_02795 [Proteobacteria bacterium]|nr:hypothetical protein [Pseudomonadota bacterium]MDA1308303.1 hypothetical protein [Pseudomonadota bacterium]
MYIFWAVTVVSTLLAVLCFAANLWIYTFNGIGEVYGWPVLYPEMNQTNWLVATGLFTGIGCVAQVLRLRAEAQNRAIITVHVPERIYARTTGVDPVLDKFQCRASVEIDVYTAVLAQTISRNYSSVIDLLESGLAIAISDPVTRFSKAKIEETLKLSLGQEFDLLDVAGVTLLNLRQERVREATPKEAALIATTVAIEAQQAADAEAPIQIDQPTDQLAQPTEKPTQNDPNAEPEAPDKPDKSELQA